MSFEITAQIAKRIHFSLADVGLPPKIGALRMNVGFEPHLESLRNPYLTELLPPIDGFEGHGVSRFVEADHGQGKTLFLNCVQEDAWSQEFVTSFVELSAHECPLDDPSKIYAAVARGLQPKPNLASDIDKDCGLDRTLERLLEQTYEGVFSGEPNDEVRAMAIDYVKDSLGSVRTDSRVFRDVCVKHLLAKLEGKEELAKITAAWLMGESLTSNDMVVLGVRESLTKSNGFLFLRSMCQFLQRSHLAVGTVILFDEARASLSLMSLRSQKIACENLLSLINQCNKGEFPGTLFLYAVMPSFFTDFATNYPALQQRCSGSVRINLLNLGMKELELLTMIGERITENSEKAFGQKLGSEATVRKNLIAVAEAAYKEKMGGSGSRRLLAKTWAAVCSDFHKKGVQGLTADQLSGYLQTSLAQLDVVDKSEVESEGE